MNRRPVAVLVIGVGNRLRGDDAAGIEVVRRMSELATDERIAIEAHEGDGLDLIRRWELADTVVLVDTVRSGAAAGTIHRLDASTEALPASVHHASSHAVGPAEAIELARVLGLLPRRVIVYGLEGTSFATGAELSPALARAIDSLVAAVHGEAHALAPAR